MNLSGGGDCSGLQENRPGFSWTKRTGAAQTSVMGTLFFVTKMNLERKELPKPADNSAGFLTK